MFYTLQSTLTLMFSPKFLAVAVVVITATHKDRRGRPRGQAEACPAPHQAEATALCPTATNQFVSYHLLSLTCLMKTLKFE